MLERLQTLSYFSTLTSSRCYENPSKCIITLHDTIHIGQEGDARGAEDDGHDPDPYKLLMQNHPRKDIDKGGVGCKQGSDN